MAAAPAALAQLNASTDFSGQTAAVPATPPPSAAPAPPTAAGIAPPANVNILFSPPSSPVAAGTTFQVPVVLTGGRDVASVPLQIQYDPAKLSLVNVTSGDLLARDNQAVGLVHRDDGPGNITINAARPPGVAGITGAGVVCVLSFQAKAPGESALSLTRGATITSAQQNLPAPATRVSIVVR
jgi:general secretion pathway protein D